MYIDFKTTIWERVEVPDSISGAVSRRIRSGKCDSANDVFQDFGGEGLTCKVIDDTSEQISPEENSDNSTIEMFSSKDKLLFSNQK